jgi:AcrR family transcriptional regulator
MLRLKQPYIRKDERRMMIADAARTLVLRNGIAGLRTRDVAAAVGINISTLHFHVPTKAALVALVAETTLETFLALLPCAPTPGRPAREQLRAEAQAYHDSLCNRPELTACFAQLAQIGAAEPEIATMLDSFSAGWCQRYAEILAIGKIQGVFRDDLDTLPAALAMTGALTAFGSRNAKNTGMFWPVFNELERGFLSRNPTVKG